MTRNYQNEKTMTQPTVIVENYETELKPMLKFKKKDENLFPS